MQIKAIPTRYAGVQFRSRLEARWAAFFDLVGWKWDYEPIELNGWIPDFTLKHGCVLVEVKPARLATDACAVEAISDYARAGSDRPFLLLGVGPSCGPSNNCLGWLINGADFPDDYRNPAKGNAEALWREAGNLTQWKGVSARPGLMSTKRRPERLPVGLMEIDGVSPFDPRERARLGRYALTLVREACADYWLDDGRLRVKNRRAIPDAVRNWINMNQDAVIAELRRELGEA